MLEKVEYTAQSVVCRAEIQGETGFIIDSSYDKSFRDFLFVSMEKELKLKDDDGVLEFNSSLFAQIDVDKEVDSKILKSDQSNTAIIYNDRYFFKFYRKIEKEINPDLEIVRFLSEHTAFRNSPGYAGSVEYRDQDGQTIVFGLLQEKSGEPGRSVEHDRRRDRPGAGGVPRRPHRPEGPARPRARRGLTRWPCRGFHPR
ncbi:MAG: hypothetical protein HC859_11035 [Bacteroidia bacterium]|nr:hypothetical protein [Bacteroidia bacterium]